MAGWKELLQRREVQVAAGLAVVAASALLQRRGRASGAQDETPAPVPGPTPGRATSGPTTPSYAGTVPATSGYVHDPVAAGVLQATAQMGIDQQRFMNNLNQGGAWQPIP